MPCRHQFRQSGVPDYERCSECGTYKSRCPMPPQALYNHNYWTGHHGSVWSQVWNVDMHTENGVCKNRFVLDRIEAVRGSALDIGCAPGRLLYWLREAARFKVIVGIDTSTDEETIRKIGCFGGQLLTKLFPEATKEVPDGTFDYISAIDVVEHSTVPSEFLAECFRLLAPKGQLFLITPLCDELDEKSRFFNALEHTYLHSAANMKWMLQDAGFKDVKFDRWTIGHDSISATKPSEKADGIHAA